MILHQAPDHLLFLHGEMTADWHSHHFIQIGIGQFKLTIEGQDAETINALVIGSKVKHRLEALSSQCATLLVDNTSDFGRFLQESVLKHGPVARLSACDVELSYPSLLASLATRLGYLPHKLQLDHRMSLLLELLAADPTISLATLGERVNLSPSRLSHVFKQQMHMSFRSYQRHIKIITAIRLLRNANKLTDIALEAGFNDSAHFSNTIREYFGTSPKTALAALEYHEHSHSIGQLVASSAAEA